MDQRKKTIVIGLGNPLSGDDGFGSRVLELLQKSEPYPNIDLINAHTDLLGQIESFSSYDRILLLDAILDPDNKLGRTGSIVLIREDDFSSWPESSPGVHQMSPLLAVKLFRKLSPSTPVEIKLVGLLVDRIEPAPVYATETVLKEAADKIRDQFLKDHNKKLCCMYAIS